MKKYISLLCGTTLLSMATLNIAHAEQYYTDDGLAEPEEYPAINGTAIPSKSSTVGSTATGSFTLPANTLPIDHNSDESLMNPDDDQRKVVENVLADPYRKNVFIYTEWAKGCSSYGSGAMVGPDSVLTAGHVIYQSACGGLATKIEVIAGAYYGGPKVISNKLGTSVGISSYVLSKYVNMRDSNYDIGFIKLKDKLGNTTGTYGVSTGIKAGDSIMVSGFPGDGKVLVGNQYYSKGKILSTDEFLAYHNADAMDAQSGAPIVKESDPNQIVAVHAHGASNYGPLQNNGVMINSNNLDTIRHWIEKPLRQKYDKKISISREDEKLWSNFDFSKYKSTTTGQLGKVYDAKYLYNHNNKYTYLSLYDKDGVWAGYTNINHVKDVNRTTIDKTVTIKNLNYDFWTSLFFDTKKNQSDSYLNKNLKAKYMYELADGRQYYTVYDSADKFIGYINVKSTL